MPRVLQNMNRKPNTVRLVAGAQYPVWRMGGNKRAVSPVECGLSVTYLQLGVSLQNTNPLVMGLLRDFSGCVRWTDYAFDGDIFRFQQGFEALTLRFSPIGFK